MQTHCDPECDFFASNLKGQIMCSGIMNFTLSVVGPLRLLWTCWLNRPIQRRVRCGWPHWQYLPAVRFPSTTMRLIKTLVYPDLRQRIAQIFTERFRQW